MDRQAIEEIKERLEHDLKRVEDVKGIYEAISEGSRKDRSDAGGDARGTTSERERDLIRCEVVFLNMALEDFLRSLLVQYAFENMAIDAPIDSGDGLQKNMKNISIPINEIRRFMQGDKKDHDAFFKQQLEAYIQTTFGEKNFSNTDSIIELLNRLSISNNVKKALELDGHGDWASIKDEIDRLMERRHHIVHKGDKHVGDRRQGDRRNQPIKDDQIVEWQSKVKTLTDAIINALV